MNWKQNIQLVDIDADTRVELTCRRCKRTRYALPSDLGRRDLYLDEAEAAQSCHRPVCFGDVSITLSTQHLSGNFSGGIS